MKYFFHSLICILFTFATQNANAQSFERDVIGSAGTYVTSANVSMGWTIGEVITETYSSTGNFFTQGFHQPDTWEEMVATDFFIPEGFSPNNDAINDLFVIRGIDNYPNNAFVIFNRWGDKVFGDNPYKNTWDGRCSIGLRFGGEELPVGTYFYILDLGDGSKYYKGTIYLNR